MPKCTAPYCRSAPTTKNFFWNKNLFSNPTSFSKKKFGHKTFFDSKLCWTQNFMDPFFLTQFCFWNPSSFCTQHFFWAKYCFRPYFFEPEFVYRPNLFLDPRLFLTLLELQKIFTPNSFQIWNFYVLKINLDLKFFFILICFRPKCLLTQNFHRSKNFLTKFFSTKIF